MFSATFRLAIITTKPVPGTTMEEALVHAKKLNVRDFITFKPGAEYTDGAHFLVSIGEPDQWTTD